MFGYVKVYVPELRMRENEFYRAVYCGLCREMKRVTGRMSTLTLSYDMVFLVLTRLAVTGERYDIKPHRCGLHPIKRSCRHAMCTGPQLSYAAAVSALLTRNKLEDDINDETGIRRVRAKLMLPHVKRAQRRFSCGDELTEYVNGRLNELYSAERDAAQGKAEASADRGAEIFGDITGYIFAYGIDGDSKGDGECGSECSEKKRILYEIGRGCGRYTYLTDAADDVTEDIARGRYNALAALWHDEITDGLLSERAATAIGEAITLELSRAAGAVELIETPAGGYPEPLEIVKNIIYLGRPSTLRAVLSCEYKGGGHKRKKSASGAAAENKNKLSNEDEREGSV